MSNEKPVRGTPFIQNSRKHVLPPPTTTGHVGAGKATVGTGSFRVTAMPTILTEVMGFQVYTCQNAPNRSL